MDAGLVGFWALWGSIGASAMAVLSRWPAMTRRGVTHKLLGAAALLALVSTASLTVALLSGDFSLEYVARTTSLATPWPYRFAALWGAMEGSLLFYATLTLSVGWLGCRRVTAHLGVTAARVVSVVGLGLLVLTVTMASPFTRLEVPAVDGEGLLAILQHPAMVYHPPILYLGLTSLVVPFALTVAAVVHKQTDRDWVRTTRRWLLASWSLLTVGMVAGANWAYVELGWGGFWAWDPVENTSLMPWLATTVFIHTSRIQERDSRLVRWNVGSALLPFVLTLLGVYLTRSGVTGSVHAFAESPVIGRVLLGAAIIGLLFGIGLALRADRGEPWERVSLLGRDTWLAGSAGLVTIALVFVTVGSAYPAYLQVFFDESALVRPAFFVTVLLPLAIVLAVGLVFAFETRWAPMRLSGSKIWWYVIGAVVSAITAVVTLDAQPVPAIALLGLAAATVLVLSLDLARVKPSGLALAGHLAHIGIAMVLAGGAGSSLGEDFTATMGPGDVARLERYSVEVDAIRSGEGDRFIFAAADLTVAREDGSSFELSPEIRAYEEQPLPVPEPALHSTPVEDVVLAISRVSGDATVVEVTVFVRPLVFWVWAGAVLIAVAGLVALYATGGDAARRRRSAREELHPTGTTISD